MNKKFLNRKEIKEINVMFADTPSQTYLNFVNAVFDNKKVNIVIYKKSMEEEYTGKQIDVLFFTGGEDVNPSLYGENKGKFTGVNTKRDEFERSMYNNFIHAYKIGICRGSQFLTVMAGGKLIQHVSGHGGTHEIQTAEFMPKNIFMQFPMSSTHHQMMFPFDMQEEKFKLISWSLKHRSDTYLNGDNKEKVLPQHFLEPEIIYYSREKSLAIQGHPEFENIDERTFSFVKKLIKKYILA